MRRFTFTACGVSLLAVFAAVFAAGCASRGAVDPPLAPPATHSAVVLAAGDERVAAAVHRVVLGGDSRILEQMLEAGAFNDCLSDDEAASFLDLARSVPVTGADGGRDPERGARRLIYAMLAARVASRGTWEEAEDWLDAAGDDAHRNDIAAGFAVTDWWPEGRVAAARTDAERAAWRGTLARVLAESTDGLAKSRFVRNAHGKLGLLPRSAAEPEDDRRRAAEFLRGLLDRETDEATREALRAALAATGFAPDPAEPDSAAVAR